MKEKRREEVRRGKVIQQRGVQIKTSRYNDRFEWEKKKISPGSVEFLIRIFGCVPASRCVVRILRFRKHRDARSSSRFFVPLTFFSFSIISYLSTFSTHPPFQTTLLKHVIWWKIWRKGRRSRYQVAISFCQSWSPIPRRSYPSSPPSR